MPQALEPQAPLTRGCNEVTMAGPLHPLDIHRLPGHATLTRGRRDDSPAYNNSMVDIYRAVTAHGQPNFRGAHIILPSNSDFHHWSSIAYEQVLQFLKFGFPAGFEGPIPTLAMSKLT